MNKYLQCKCGELGPQELTPAGLQARIDAFIKYRRFYAVLATVESPMQMALLQCRVCKKLYQESPCGRGMNTMRYVYAIPEVDKKQWEQMPFPDPYANVLKTVEAQDLGLTY